MNTQQFEQLVKKKALEIQQYAMTKFPTEAGNTALRFINGNFRAQGWQGASFKPWKTNKRKGRILVKKGHLRSASYYVSSPGVATIRNTMPYAKIHNEGGTITGTANVRSFIKKAYSLKKTKGRGKIQVRSHAVKAHTRNMNTTIPQRQFAPTDNSPSPVLDNAIARNISRELQRIFNI